MRDDLTDDDHRQLDSWILHAFKLYRSMNQEPHWNSLLLLLTIGDKRLKRLTDDEATDLLGQEPWIKDMLRRAWHAQSFKEVRQCEIFWPVEKGTHKLVDNLLPRVEYEPSKSVTLASWDIEYRGNADHLLYEHMQHYMNRRGIYARYMSIVQSSGMGKSRTVDQLSKKHLVVPLNFRKEPGGFPPADDNVRDWFLRSMTKMQAFTRASAFLCALFEVLLRYLQRIKSNSKGPGELVANFRDIMTSGQTFSSQGPQRSQFYKEVLDLAGKIWMPELSIQKQSSPKPLFQKIEHDLKDSVKKLIEYLIGNVESFETCPLALIISFDEAHTLATALSDSDNNLWSILSELRRALRLIRSYPCFSLFISTTGKVISEQEDDPSNRIYKGHFSFIPPFCKLGFDQMAEKVVSGETTLHDVSSKRFMASLGRPLFAARYLKGVKDIKEDIIMFAGEKLLSKPFSISDEFVYRFNYVDKLACISVRIPLEFNFRTLRSQDLQRTLVEKHMRVCLSVDGRLETAITVAPSEPLLAEASYLLMQNPAFDLPRCLLEELKFPGLDKGSRGELVTMTLCLLARDAAATRLNNRITPVIEFIKELLAPSAHNEVLQSMPVLTRRIKGDKTFEDTFRNSNIYFNHFVKFRDRRLINREYLWRLIARGAAGICADLKCGIDVVIPFLYRDDVLRRENVSAVFFQSKNDKSFKTRPESDLFDMMDPYRIGFFDKREISPVPVIRMVFALASSKPKVVVLQGSQRTLPARYTAFDIWCAKASRKTFRQIKYDTEFEGILIRPDVFGEFYETKESKDVENARRKTNPATDVHVAHWDWFRRA